jgi:hypothetical protein
MSGRASIAKAIADKIADQFVEGSTRFVTNLYGNVGTKAKHFDDIASYPYVSVSPGPETRDQLPSRQTWGELTLYIRIYVSDADDAQGVLETIIADIENFVDINQRVSYNITRPDGTTELKETVSCDTVSIATDEGLLDPLGLGEVTVSIRYEKNRII